MVGRRESVDGGAMCTDPGWCTTHHGVRCTMRTLVTWTDRGAGRAPDHHSARPTDDHGPVLRLLAHVPRYDRLVIVVPPAGLPGARRLAAEAPCGRAELRLVDVDDPSDHRQIFEAVGPIADELRGVDGVDVLLSAGTAQVQTIWVILVEAGLFRARMLQVIPARFVPDPHPHPVREVHLPIDGFPEIRALREEVGRLRADEAARVGGMVGDGSAMRELRARLGRVSPTDVPVLVHGETGTGKELVARALHHGSLRAAGPFVVCNGGALDDGLLTSELFGHEAGAFTGAVARRRGLFELAHGGTLFLDEVGELSARVQVGLLRVLQDGEIRRLGGEKPIRVDVRLVAATHRDLRAAVRDGVFREDLWFRLCGAVLEVPALRERTEDLPALVQQFLDEVGRPGLVVSPEVWQRLVAWSWPGNVRELRAEIVRWSVFCDRRVGVPDLSFEAPTPAPQVRRDEGRIAPLAEVVARAEQDAIRAAWAVTGHNVSAAARGLGIDRNTLKRKLRRYGLV
jgi:two-component system, NtrC family, response regulator AtoC